MFPVSSSLGIWKQETPKNETMHTTAERFTLEKYRTPASRHTCPECGKRREFTRYVDALGVIQFPDYVGKCNREMNCGYHFPPRSYFQQAGIQFDREGNVINPFTRQPATPIKYNSTRISHATPLEGTCISPVIMQRSLADYDNNNLAKFLLGRFGSEISEKVLRHYHVGTSKHWAGATVFWQVDGLGKVRSGKVMLYDSATGRRDKREPFKPTWAHSLLRLPDFQLRQCFFGEHLLTTLPGRVVAVVESEKTALIASIYFAPLGYTWLATGGKSFPALERWEPLRNRKIMLFPDAGLPKGTNTKTPFQEWSEKAGELHRAGFQATVSDLLERRANMEEKENGADLADFLLRFDPKEFQRPQKAVTSATIAPTANLPQPDTLLPGCQIEQYTDRFTGQPFEVVLNENGYPAAWDLPDSQQAALSKMIKAAPTVTELIARFDLKPCLLASENV